MMESPLTRGVFACDVCGRFRRSEQIATATHAHTDANGVTVYQNVKYCTDSDTCERIARVRSLTDLAAQKAAEDRITAIERLWHVERAKLHITAYASLAAFVAGFVIRGGIG